MVPLTGWSGHGGRRGCRREFVQEGVTLDLGESYPRLFSQHPPQLSQLTSDTDEMHTVR